MMLNAMLAGLLGNGCRTELEGKADGFDVEIEQTAYLASAGTCA
jgi:hypothetical protein